MSVAQASLRIPAAEENISLLQLAANFLRRSTKSNSHGTFGEADEQRGTIRQAV
jgi:hypothetical protein